MKNEIETLDIAAARAVIAKATPGPWFSRPCFANVKDGPPCWCKIVDQGEDDDRGVIPSGCASGPDADFIAAARTGWEQALDEVERLRAAGIDWGAAFEGYSEGSPVELREQWLRVEAERDEWKRGCDQLRQAVSTIAAERDAAHTKVDQLYASIESSDAHTEKLARIAAQAERDSLRSALLAAEQEADSLARQVAGLECMSCERIERETVAAICDWFMQNAEHVDLTDPSCPVGTALTELAEQIRAGAWRKP